MKELIGFMNNTQKLTSSMQIFEKIISVNSGTIYARSAALAPNWSKG